MDIAAYVLGGIGGLILVFAGLHGYENKSVTIVAFGVGAIFVIIGICCFWQDSVLLLGHVTATPPSSMMNVRRFIR